MGRERITLDEPLWQIGQSDSGDGLLAPYLVSLIVMPELVVLISCPVVLPLEGLE